ncbi:hypothetical protein A3A76_01365 [Candidatus Woesebacteria bacterium RIFCSPLOWO2_01_FULL_39_23]|uniref:Cell envelope-related transcriptional attenuator domain-containing protein n=1 Tax=Candidatus Woesebacteria bacterium RIFCSPHIGHO2_01_FULL_40_22 TaxID=1802499 RepID=A0A1F7YGN5_9BACT|nr:MAG: hypothetical protein A2141_05005 [Candidatus Woesebacteria bacterium RBG_16_40_11]OGM26473.1 MAG: hypothetical protein A2628_02960 [Candidatus Woesebacteria bacterium RIFCSPHIGHO2_01_FULL_40_22]OGM62926.1 MAG: hypothetical protein A3A76_01365 [Candidatus Woesebacteria bacterium RIFCSPLOWO2_01_FULL_39_23]
MKPPRPLAIALWRGILSDLSKRGYILNSIHPHPPAIASRWGILEMRIKIKKLFLPLLLITFLVFIVYLITIYKRVVVNQPNVITILNTKITPSPTPTPDPLAPRNILLLGYAGGDHEGATLTDTLIIAHIVPKENNITLISIPRDLFVPLQVETEKEEKFKINHAFAIGLDDKKYPNKPPQYKGLAGGGALAKDTVSKVTGLPIDNYIAISFEGFKNIITILGGVEVNIPYAFEDKFYPITGKEKDTCGKSDDNLKIIQATMSGQLLEQQFTCRFETINYAKGKTLLDAENALKFVRSRHSETNGNDFGRSLRQQALIIAIKNKILRISSIPKIAPIINSFSRNVMTDIDIKTAIGLLEEKGKMNDVIIKSVSLSTDNVLKEAVSSDRQYILLPKDGEENWQQIHDFIVTSF